MNLPRCTGMGDKGDHCCYQAGQRCPHLVENVAGRRYACGLFLELGSWEAVNASPKYKPIGEFWVTKHNPFNYCETFDPAFCCRPELRQGRANDRDEVTV